MAIQCVVLDFDGTFTDVATEGAPFLLHFRSLLEKALERSLAEAWEQEQEQLQAGAAVYGWEVGGYVVAPATADPFLMATCIGQRLCERLGVLKEAEQRARVLHAVYREAYAHAGVHFKPEARAVLEALLGTGLPVFVVTNAHTEAAEKKLAWLKPQGLERLRVYGDARKFLVQEPTELDPGSDQRFDPLFSALPARLELEELGRPVWLRRGLYYERLRHIWRETGTGPAQTLVAGDIYELDLALPAALGAQVQLVARANVLPYEQRAVEALGERGRVDTSLWGVVERVRRALLEAA